MKYLRKIKRADGSVVHRFTPPPEAVKAGIVSAKTYEDGRAARYEVPRLIAKVEAFQRGELAAKVLTPKSTVRQVIANYLESDKFMSLSPTTRGIYKKRLATFGRSSVGGVAIGMVDFELCKKVYDDLEKDYNLKQAIFRAGIFSSLLTFAYQLNLIPENPMHRLKRHQAGSHAKDWTRAQVELFVDTAFTKFEWRSTGLLALMCYEWAQRPYVIGRLEWHNLDLDAGRVTLCPLSKAKPVELPIEEPLLSLLKSQKKDWDFQKLVLPYYRKSDNSYRPLSGDWLSATVAKIKEESGLPRELQLNGLRKTAITELLAAGVDSLRVIQVTGHSHLHGLTMYQKNTYDGAKSALEQRKKT
jgi:integrase